MSIGLKRVLMMALVSAWGALADWSAFGFAAARGLFVPEFNFAIAWLIRTILIFSAIGYFAWWTRCAGEHTKLQRTVLWIALTTCFVAPDVPVFSSTVTMGAGRVGHLAAGLWSAACLGYLMSMKRLYRSLWPQIESGVDSDEENSPIASVLFLQYPPRRRLDMVMLDVLVLIGLWYALSGAWLVL